LVLSGGPNKVWQKRSAKWVTYTIPVTGWPQVLRWPLLV
jgi:hypothetical protein